MSLQVYGLQVEGLRWPVATLKSRWVVGDGSQRLVLGCREVECRRMPPGGAGRVGRERTVAVDGDAGQVGDCVVPVAAGAPGPNRVVRRLGACDPKAQSR